MVVDGLFAGGAGGLDELGADFRAAAGAPIARCGVGGIARGQK